MPKFSVTFERYHICEADERGFIIEDVSLRDAMRLGLEYREASHAGACEANCYPPRGVRWLSFYNWNDCTMEQIERGIIEDRSLHFPATLTEASRVRICRLFGVRGV